MQFQFFDILQSVSAQEVLWHELSTTFLKNHHQPRTVADAEAAGWIRINGCEDTRCVQCGPSLEGKVKNTVAIFPTKTRHSVVHIIRITVVAQVEFISEIEQHTRLLSFLGLQATGMPVPWNSLT